MKGWEKRQANEKARYRNKKVEERRENDWLSKTRQSYPHVSVRPSVSRLLLCQLENICTGCSHFVAGETKSPLNPRLCSQPTSTDGHRPLFVREARITTPLCQYVSTDIWSRGEAARYFYRSRRANSYLPTPPRHADLYVSRFASRFHTLRRSNRDPLSPNRDSLFLPTDAFFLSFFFPRPNLPRELFLFFEFLSFPFQFFVLQIANKFFFFSFLFKFKILLGKSVEKISRLCFSSRSFCRFFFSRPTRIFGLL